MMNIPVNGTSIPSNQNVGRFMVVVGAILEHPDSGTILLLKRDGVDFNSGVWETGYGRLDQGEEPGRGLKREFKEETGLKIEPKEILSARFYNRGKKKQPENEGIVLTYWATSNSQNVKLSQEHSEYRWVIPEEAMEVVTEQLVRNEIQAFIQAKEKSTAVETANDKYQRALADYNNLMRRTQQERGQIAKLASLRLVEELLQPIEHLKLAAKQLDDAGLYMVEKQLWQVLSEHGLEEIEVLGQPFNVETMEAVESEAEGDRVVKVLRPGYTLNGEVIQHAKVVLGNPND